MLYTVEDAAIKLNVSKVTVYNKLKLNQFKDKTVTKQGQTMVDDDLLNLIKDTIKLTNSFTDNNIDGPEEPQESEIITNEDMVNMNKALLNALLDQLKEKDLQIHGLNDLLATEQELNKNNQILQLRQPQDIKALESHFQDLDTKLEEVKEKMQERKQDQEPKGFLSKLFNKK